MKVLITGGAGYIGSTTASALEHAGHVPIVLDSLVRGHPAFVRGRIFYRGEVADHHLLRRILTEHPDIEAVLHMAARIEVPESVREPIAYYRENVTGSLELAAALAETGPPRLVFSSSASVYAGEVQTTPPGPAQSPTSQLGIGCRLMHDPGENERPHRTTPLSFTRRGGRLKERQQRVWDEIGERFVLDVPRAGASTSVDPEVRFDATATFGRQAPLVVEIGSGHGDTVCAAALARPDVDFLALEVWIPGLAQTLLTIRREGIENVRVAEVNAPEALATWLPEHGVRELHTWFPDPWHKLKHHKRRMITVPFTRQVARVLEPGGVWRMATDWADYADQMERVIAESDAVEGGRCDRYEGRPVTRFENKGIAKGREIHDLQARPIS